MLPTYMLGGDHVIPFLVSLGYIAGCRSHGGYEIFILATALWADVSFTLIAVSLDYFPGRNIDSYGSIARLGIRSWL